MVYIAPSLLAADFSRLAEEVGRIERADMLHVDVMDGHFVPNLSIGPAVVEALRKKTKLPFDVHLMMEEPLAYIGVFRQAGADIITFHIECQDPPQAVIAARRGHRSMGRGPEPNHGDDSGAGVRGAEHDAGYASKGI